MCERENVVNERGEFTYTHNIQSEESKFNALIRNV